jgi:hypothetical protein
MAEPGFFLIYAVDVDLSVRVGHGDGAPIPSGGYGGYQPAPRRRRVSVTEWQGVDPMQYDVPFLLDGLTTGVSQNDKMDNLEVLAASPDGQNDPPVVRVKGPRALRLQGFDLVLNDIQWDRDLMVVNKEYDAFMRAGGTLTFMRHIKDRHLEHLDAATQNRLSKPRKAKHSRHRVAKGETLKDIALKELGDASRSKEIADLNNIRDPRSIHVGQVLKMP